MSKADDLGGFESYEEIAAEAQKVEDYLKETIEECFNFKVTKFDNYDLKNKLFVGAFQTNTKRRYSFVIAEDGIPVIKPI